ncbi:MAG: hypothetical protein WBM66_07055, partial [Thiothrix litoralis]
MNRISKNIMAVILTVSLSGCIGDDDGPKTTSVTNPTATEGLSSAAANTTTKINSIGIKLVGDGKDKFQSDNNANKFSAAEKVLLGREAADLTNAGSALTLMSGNFYDIDVDFSAKEDHPDGLDFEITLVNTADKSSEIIDALVSDPITAGDTKVTLDTLIPAEVTTGEYILIAKVLKEDLAEISEHGSSATEETVKSIDKIPEIGGINVRIEHDENATQVDMVDAEIEEPYIDLEYPGDFAEDGYTFESVGDAYISVFNTSQNSQNVIITGTLILDNGNEYALGLLDTEKDEITDELQYNIPSNGEESSDLSVVYFVHEEDYADVLAYSPDFSLSEDAEEAIANIRWELKSADTDVIDTSAFETEVSLAKFSSTEEFNDEPLTEQASSQNRLASKSASEIAAEIFNSGKLFGFEGKDSKVFGNKDKFALSGSYEYNAEALWSLPSASAKGNADISVHILKAQSKLISVESSVQASYKTINPKFKDAAKKAALKRRTGMKIEVAAIGVTFYSKNTMEEEVPKESEAAFEQLSQQDKEDKVNQYQEEAKEEKKGLSMPKYEWKEKKVVISTRFIIGPVPLKIEGGFSGSIKINTGLGLEGVGVALTAEIPVKASAFMTGGIDVVVTKAGIEGEIELLDFYVGKRTVGNDGSPSWSPTGVTAGLRLKDNKLVASASAQTDIKLNAIRGKVSLYASTRTKVKWCKSWGVWY